MIHGDCDILIGHAGHLMYFDCTAGLAGEYIGPGAL